MDSWKNKCCGMRFGRSVDKRKQQRNEDYVCIDYENLRVKTCKYIHQEVSTGLEIYKNNYNNEITTKYNT